MNIIMGLIPQLLLIFYFYKFLLFWAKRKTSIIFTLAFISFAYLGFAYSSTINNHAAGATSIFIAFYYAVLLRQKDKNNYKYYALCGLCAGLAPTFDLPSLFFSLAIFVYLLTYNYKRTLFVFCIVALIPLITHFILTYISSGSLLPIYLRKELYNYPGSGWEHYWMMDSHNEPKHIYFFNMTFGHHGLFSITPLFLLSLLSVFKHLRPSSEYFKETLLFFIPFVTIFIFLLLKTSDYGGSCVGFRWLIICMPLLASFLALWLDRNKSKILNLVFLVFFALSQYNAYNALNNPWVESTLQKMMRSL